ncbi:hypothetical protein LIER_27867 [Lithospermum erythrorhizon]|uniref:Uncharacterized protein n=1 Tax=Lithospermum erythrorhizon TaxID=34254 RepID=A0AAV3RHH6_LITER
MKSNVDTSAVNLEDGHKVQTMVTKAGSGVVYVHNVPEKNEILMMPNQVSCGLSIPPTFATTITLAAQPPLRPQNVSVMPSMLKPSLLSF